MKRTVAEIIREHGASEIAERIGVPGGTVRMWKARNRIPAEHWRALADHEIASLDELADAAAHESEAVEHMAAMIRGAA